MNLRTSELFGLLVCLVVFGTSRTICGQDNDRGLSIDPVIAAYQPTANRIIAAARAGNDSYLKLQELCDDIGHRLAGSEALDQAVQWAVQSMQADEQENVRAESVTIQKWLRGKESCELIMPRPLKIDMLGLGGSVATPVDGITAEVIVVADKNELDALSDKQLAGKIVVFNAAMPPYSEIAGSGYGQVVQYRSNGASWAAERGAVAALVRSVTAYSLASPHTGAMRYDAKFPKIPVAAISVEAATLLSRWQQRGKKCVVKLSMEAADAGDAPSANVLAEIVGSEFPEQIVLIGGHLDSWDVGHGAQDDGAGCVAAMEALNILRRLNLRPKRTIRVVLWTNEENGTAGAKDYLVRHQNEVHVAGIESDSGGFTPQGLSIEMEDEARQQVAVTQLAGVLDLLKPIGPMRVRTEYSGTDVGYLKMLGTACMGLSVDGRLYFNTHHTWADTVDKVNPQELTECAITVAIAAYVIADLPMQLGAEK